MGVLVILVSLVLLTKSATANVLSPGATMRTLVVSI